MQATKELHQAFKEIARNKNNKLPSHDFFPTHLITSLANNVHTLCYHVHRQLVVEDLLGETVDKLPQLLHRPSDKS